jgi:hypothetical protein
VSGIRGWTDPAGPGHIRALANSRELDHPLTVLEQASPRNPGRLVDPEGRGGTAVLDFIIDETGRPRVPVVVRTDHLGFAVAAAEALESWRFEVPRRGGTPVAVRAQQVFVFSGRKPQG